MSLAPIPFIGVIPEILKSNKGIITELATNEEVRKEVVNKVIPSTPSFFSISHWLELRPKIEEIANEMHKQALLTPDLNDDKIDYVKYLYDYVSTAPATHFMPDWIKEIVIVFLASANHYSHSFIQYMFKQVYKLVTNVVLFTPEWIFQNSWFPSSVSKFTTISVGIVTAITMFEGILRIMKRRVTPLKDLLKKFPIALGVSALTPFLFTNGLRLLNKATQLILNFASDEIASSTTTNVYATSLLFEPINILLMLIFIGMVGWFMIPLILFNAKRWFSFVANAMLTPLAMSAYLFDSTQSYFHTWLRNIKNLAYTQLMYAGLVAILGLLLFATPNPDSLSGAFAKMLVAIGGLATLANPPQLVRQYDGRKFGIPQAISEFKRGKANLENKKEKGENIMIGSASIAGKIYRLFNK